MSADLVRFVEARIAEWETEARDAIDERERTSFVRPETATEPDYSLQSWPDTGVPAVLVGPELVLRQCEAFRRIVALNGRLAERLQPRSAVIETLCIIASVWADHPDYRQEWAG